MMQSSDLREKIERSLPHLSLQDLARIADLIDGLEQQKTLNLDSVVRQRWLDRLCQNRSKLSVQGINQTALEMREEEQY